MSVRFIYQITDGIPFPFNGKMYQTTGELKSKPRTWAITSMDGKRSAILGEDQIFRLLHPEVLGTLPIRGIAPDSRIKMRGGTFTVVEGASKPDHVKLRAPLSLMPGARSEIRFIEIPLTEAIEHAAGTHVEDAVREYAFAGARNTEKSVRIGGGGGKRIPE